MFQMHTHSLLACAITSVLLAGCGGSDSSSDVPSSIASPNINGTPSLSSVSAYQVTAQSDNVEACSTAFLSNNSCDLSVIQPIGVDGQDVTIEQIKERLVVSHEWMADSFISALEEMADQDLLNLFKPLNSIVISYDIRPSFYTTATASMYIDPKYVWRTKSEWDSIYQQQDYRAKFQTEFQFDKASRYVDKSTNNYVTYSNTYDANYNSARLSSHIAPGLFRLLAHELAHANDFLQAHDLVQIPDSGTINSYIWPLVKLNEDLTASNPLTSELLTEAAQIAFRGETMTDRVRDLTGELAGAEFEEDSAAAFYSYSSPAEDVAMLFEAYMMYRKYGALSDFAFVSIPQTTNYTCNDWKVLWGQRSRLSEEDVLERAVFVAQGILDKPEASIRAELASLPATPQALVSGSGWCESQQMSQAYAEELRSLQSSNFASGFSDNPRYKEDLED